MSQQVSNRHEGDLGGQFSPFGEVKPVGVTVVVPSEIAGFPAVQHTAWMLVNLLGRFAGVVNRVGILCPSNVKQCGRVTPLAPADVALDDALVTGGNAIGVVPVEKDGRLDRLIVVGPAQGFPDCDLFCLGSGWCGGVSRSPEDLNVLDPRQELPFGPYLAACLAAGEVFKSARMHGGTYAAPTSAFYSAWTYGVSEEPISGGPQRLDVSLNATLAGVGAVGSAFLHALWACPGIGGSLALVDNDPKGLELTNLNRYSLFGTANVGQPKATAAATLLSGGLIQLTPYNLAIESHQITTPRVVSAVDRNSARAAIQFQYPPIILSGSTSDLRAEVLRCGPPGAGACLRCFNEPEKMAPDEDLRAKLRNATDAEIEPFCEAAQITIAEAREWISTGRCGLAGEQLLSMLRRNEDEQEFAVAFVSVMAGTLLAAELVKEALDDVTLLSETHQRAAFQFFSPLARSNRAAPFQRDPKCPMCDTASIATRHWQQRYEALRGRDRQS